MFLSQTEFLFKSLVPDQQSDFVIDNINRTIHHPYCKDSCARVSNI